MERCGAEQDNVDCDPIVTKRVRLNEQHKAKPRPNFSRIAGGVLPRPSAIPPTLAGYNGERLRRQLKGVPCRSSQ